MTSSERIATASGGATTSTGSAASSSSSAITPAASARAAQGLGYGKAHMSGKRFGGALGSARLPTSGGGTAGPGSNSSSATGASGSGEKSASAGNAKSSGSSTVLRRAGRAPVAKTPDEGASPSDEDEQAHGYSISESLRTSSHEGLRKRADLTNHSTRVRVEVGRRQQQHGLELFFGDDGLAFSLSLRDPTSLSQDGR